MVATATPDHELGDLQAILDLLPHGIIVVTRDWRVLYSNLEADRMLGTVGATLWERCPALEHTAFASGFRYAMSDQTELLTESALPSVGWCQARARPTADGDLLISLRQVHAYTIETGQARAALLLGEIGDALTREDSLRAALRRCTDAIVRNLDAALARIWTVDATAQTLSLCASAGIDTRLDGEHALLRFADHKVGTIAEDGVPYLTNDVSTDAHVGNSEWTEREKLVAFAGYPLRIEDRIVGVMAMYSRRKLDHDTLNGLSAIADALALGIASKTADEARRAAEAAMRKHAGDVEVMHELGQQLAAVLELEALAQKVVDATTRLAGAHAGAFAYRASDGSPQRAVAGGAHADLARRLPIAPTLDDHRPVRIADLHDSEISVTLPSDLVIASYLAVPVTGRSGRMIGALVFAHLRPGVFTEETERLISGVAATAAIAMDNARLFDEARGLISALEKSNRELDQFAYVASHDLKAPLRGIANLSQWIEDDLGDRLDDQTRGHLGLLRGRVIRLENLIAGILAYSRAGRDNTEQAVVDVAGLVAEVWELLAPPATAHLELATALPQIRASRVQLQQILMNLIGNAIKYNADRDLTIAISARRSGRRWQFCVADNGIGIAPEFSDKIWGLFQTLERRDKVESTGIGLSVVRKIVEGHGGTAWLESELGHGAKFFFTWMADPDEAAHAHG
ncbi:MAG TPA: GAF domain-containing protein [Kofleriaceae bacterium]|nr:GAF domain-containing protein [Kofleriaceae bacterium]